MESVIIISLAILGGLVSLSQFFYFRQKCQDSVSIFKYGVLIFSITCCAVVDGAMAFAYGNDYCFILYGLDKFIKVLFMCELIVLTQAVFEIKFKYISIVTSIIAYGALLLFFLDAISGDGEIKSSICGAYYSPNNYVHIALYFIYYLFYALVLAIFVVYKGSASLKKRHRKELFLLGISYGFSAVGFITEIYLIANKNIYIPFSLVFNLVAAIVIGRLLLYHEFIEITEGKFSKELDLGRTDIALIINDDQKVIFQNKKAEIIGQMMNDNFMGRKLSEIFKFSDSVYAHMFLKPDSIPFGVDAEYEPNEHRVNLVLQHMLDDFGEILVSTVYVYNLEDVENSVVVKEEQEELNDNQLIVNALPITQNARILIVDNDAIFLNIFTRLLSQFSVSISKAIDIDETIEIVKNQVFDMIFISHEIDSRKGYEIVKKIRGFKGSYFKQVPIVFVTEADINDIFNDFIDAGLNDYLTKPVTINSLSSVLTRWLWQRFSNDSTKMAKAESAIKSQYGELFALVKTTETMLNRKDYIKLSYALNGVKRACLVLGLIDAADDAAELQEAIMLGEESVIYDRCKSLITTINALETV